MFKVFSRGIMPDETELNMGKEKKLYESDDRPELDLKFSDYVAISIALFRSLLPFVLLIGIVYSIFVYFFLNVWLS
ncbi:hypothetical protein [Helicovermis profundi]|uniref:Uncharacterized protein n=1 Tax=Helicovermis profundi TaxID=3065157 RepID=A0AAU9EBZ3_9FIRM|nr:hypothetical protein HLPR_04130 [Clostridia bacterium S502]